MGVRDAWTSPPIQLFGGTNVLRIDVTDRAGATASDTITVNYLPPAVTKTWTGAASVDWSNVANWSPLGVPTGADAVAINGGTINVTSGFAPANLFLNGGTLNWSGGDIVAATTIAAGGVLNISGGSAKQWAGTLNNAGTVNWSGTGELRLGWNGGGPLVFNNLAVGVFDAQGDGLMQHWTSNSPTFNNVGTFRKSGGAGVTELRNVTFNNTGTVEARSGTLTFSDFLQTGGVTRLTGGGITSSSPLDIRSGSLVGDGTIGGGVISGGTIRPGFSPGTLTINGNFSPTATARFEAELNGPLPGAGYDRIVVNGGISLNGQLVASIGVIPVKNQSFIIIENDGSDPVSGTFAGLSEGAILTVAGRRLRISYMGGTGNDVVLTAIDPAAVFGRQVFYNNSVFDGGNSGADLGDVVAIASDKQALLAGGVASFANITNYSKGINGVIIDVGGLPLGSDPTAADFEFKVGRGGDPASWSAAPQPTAVVVRRGAGAGGSDRVFLTWADGAILNTWLQVTLKANALSGLTQPDVFYFGNLVGETGDRMTPLRVSTQDLVALRRNPASASVPITNRYDLNRDGRVNMRDYIDGRNNLSKSLGAITASAAGSTTAGAATTVVTSSAVRTATRRRSNFDFIAGV